MSGDTLALNLEPMRVTRCFVVDMFVVVVAGFVVSEFPISLKV